MTVSSKIFNFFILSLPKSQAAQAQCVSLIINTVM